MLPKRLLLALGAILAVASVFAGSVFWSAQRVLRNSTEQVRREGRLPFTLAALDTQLPSGFESVGAAAAFRDAAVFGDRVFVAGGDGLGEFDANGALVKWFRTGLELPSAPVTALATGIGGGSTVPELWLATAGEGALAFNGTSFRQIRPQDAAARKLTAILPLATGRVLFGTQTAGLLVFDGKQLTPLHPSLARVAVTALAGEEASLWIGTQDSGVLHSHAGRLDRFSEAEGVPDPHVFSLATSDATAYAATPLGIAEIRDSRVQRTLAQGFLIQSLAKLGTELLAGTLDEGLIRVPLEAHARPVAMERTQCPGCAIYRVLTGGGATLALTGEGLYRVGSRNGDWTPVLTLQGSRLADRNISALAPDSTGHLWIGYFDRGLDILTPRSGEARHVEDDVVFCVNRIVHGRERTAVATSNGLALFTPGGSRRQVLTRGDGLIASQVTDVLFQPDGSMVAGTPAGVSFIEPGRISSIYAFHGLVNNHVYSLAQTGPRTLVGTLGGLSVIESGIASASFTTANSGLKHNWITAVLPVANDTFIGTYGGGILHQGAGGAWVPFADLPAAFEVNPNALVSSDNAVYAGTLDRGLALYHRQAGRWRWITRGLPSANVTALAVSRGTVYIGTDNGLVRASEEVMLQ